MDLSNRGFWKQISYKFSGEFQDWLHKFQRTHTNEPMTHRQIVRFSDRSQHLTKETHLQKVIRELSPALDRY